MRTSSLYGSDRGLARDLVRAGILARDLDHARDLALLLASDPAIAFGHAGGLGILARDLDHACGLARAVARGVGCDFGRDLARELARDLVDAVGLARDVDRACDRFPFQTSAPDHARDLVRNLDHARELVLILASDPAIALGHASNREPASELARNFIREVAHNLISEPASENAVTAQHEGGQVVPLAGRLLAIATRLLPVRDRARYADEFRSELWEIAHAGAGRRRAQLAYAARQVMSAWRLRAELRVPRRRRAAP
jgi:hypothetical protein